MTRKSSNPVLRDLMDPCSFRSMMPHSSARRSSSADDARASAPPTASKNGEEWKVSIDPSNLGGITSRSSRQGPFEASTAAGAAVKVAKSTRLAASAISSCAVSSCAPPTLGKRAWDSCSSDSSNRTRDLSPYDCVSPPLESKCGSGASNQSASSMPATRGALSSTSDQACGDRNLIKPMTIAGSASHAQRCNPAPSRALESMRCVRRERHLISAARRAAPCKVVGTRFLRATARASATSACRSAALFPTEQLLARSVPRIRVDSAVAAFTPRSSQKVLNHSLERASSARSPSS
mmetsp:Transcript_796/g.2874  ORF Transcript_796/g.2874 Transcript_796/m.2874 type:complete len:294 (+) Transcript_796:3666-4547(+)